MSNGRYTYHYCCRHCTSWAVTADKCGNYVTCNGCGGSKRFEFANPVESEEDEKMYWMAKELGVAHLPIPDSQEMERFRARAEAKREANAWRSL